MATINDLPFNDTPNLSDSVPIYKTSGGVTQRTSVNQLLSAGLSSLPTVQPVSGSGELWIDPLDGNTIKVAGPGGNPGPTNLTVAVSNMIAGTATDAGALTGAEIAPLSRSSGMLQTTLTKIAQWALQSYQGFTQNGTGAVPETITAELANSLKITQFGAVPDWNGSTGTDNSSFLQNAVNYAGTLAAAGRPVMLVAPPGAYRIASTQITWPSGVILWAFGATFVLDGPAYAIRGDTLTNVGVIGATFIDNQPMAGGGTTAVRFSNASQVLLAYNTATGFKQFGFATGSFSGTDVCNDVTYIGNKVFSHGQSGLVTAIGIVHRALVSTRLTFIGNTVVLDAACTGTACKLQQTTDMIATGNILNRPANGVGSGSQCFMITDSTSVTASGNLVDNSDTGSLGAVAVSNCTDVTFSGNTIVGSNQNSYLTQAVTGINFAGNKLPGGTLFLFNATGAAAGIHMVGNDVLSLIIQDKTSLSDIVVRGNTVRSVIQWTAPGTTLAQDLFCEGNSINLAANASCSIATPGVVFAMNRITRSPSGTAQSNSLLVTGNNVVIQRNIFQSGGDSFSLTLSGALTGIKVLDNSFSGYASAQGWLGIISSPSYVAQHNIDANGKKDSFGETVSADKGDANVVLSLPSETVQIFNTPLTTNRTVTMPTTLSAGAKFRVVRTAAATGASTLTVGGIKALAAGQWVDFHVQSGTWIETAFGSL